MHMAAARHDRQHVAPRDGKASRAFQVGERQLKSQTKLDNAMAKQCTSSLVIQKSRECWEWKNVGVFKKFGSS